VGAIAMRISLLVLLAGVLFASGCVSAQQAEPSNTTATPPAKPLVVFGKISDDGKKLISDIDSEWTVSNPEMLKGLEGHLVRLKCYVDTEKNRIRVLFVKKETSELGYSARYADSAFRR
jgi:hypothetical protein